MKLPKRTLLVLAAAAASATLTGCLTTMPLGPGAAAANLSDASKALTHYFYGNNPFGAGNTEEIQVNGLYPLYVLIERANDQAPWQAVSVSSAAGDTTTKNRPFPKSNQEVLLVSTDLTNVVPAWNYTRMRYEFLWGKREFFEFDYFPNPKRNIPMDKKPRGSDYTPASSAFSKAGQGVVDKRAAGWTVSTHWELDKIAFKKAIDQSSAIERARAFQATQKK